MLSIIVAVAENGVIGCKNRLIWHISEDLKRFKRITTGHPVIMGRKTFESLDCKPLPNRVNVVVTRDRNYPETVGVCDRLCVVHSLPEALAKFPDAKEVFIIGGAEIYREALPMADKIYLTRIEASPEGDAHFPEIDTENEWRKVWHEDHPAGEDNPIGYAFIDYIRTGNRK